MKRISSLKKISSYIQAGFVAVLFVLSSCSEDRIGQNPVDSTPPSAVNNVQVEALPGGAKITYDVPNETDISYVICEYMVNNEKKITRSSIYNNYITVEGLSDTSPCEFTIYLVDHSENKSTPYTDSFIPLEPPYRTIFETLQAQPDFGGVVVTWENETRAVIGAFLLAMGDHGEWEEYDLVFSTMAEDKRSIRGYNTDLRLFGVVLTDKFGNVSDTFKIEAEPLYEKELDKKKFKDGHLLGDNFSVNSSRPLSNIWDGNLDVIWHTAADAGYLPPQTFTIDLGIEAKLSRFMLYNRGESFYYGQHNPRYFEVWATNDLGDHSITDEYWSTGPWRDNWVLLGDYEVIKPSGLPLGQVTDEDKAISDAGFEFIFESGVGEMRYLRFVVKETWARTPALHIREVTIFGDDGTRNEETNE